MPTWNFESQNYKINRKIHEELDSKYSIINKILSIYLKIVDKNGKQVEGATITIGELTLTVVNPVGTFLIKNYPREEATITVEKEGYKTISTDLIDAIRQGHLFTLEEEDSEDDSTVISWPNKDILFYDFESYADEEGETQWGTGTVQTTGEAENGYIKVKVLSNEPETSFVGRIFYISADAEPGDDLYELYTDREGTATGIYVKISEHEEPTPTPTPDPEPEPTERTFNIKMTKDGNPVSGYNIGSYTLDNNGEINNAVFPTLSNNQVDCYGSLTNNVGYYSLDNQIFSFSPMMYDSYSKLIFYYDTTENKYTNIRYADSPHQNNLLSIPENEFTLVYSIDSTETTCTVTIEEPEPTPTYNVGGKIRGGIPSSEAFDVKIQPTGNSENGYTEIIFLENTITGNVSFYPESYNPYYINFDLETDEGTEYHTVYSDTNGTAFSDPVKYYSDFQIKIKKS